jgi:hypothetical protein
MLLAWCLAYASVGFPLLQFPVPAHLREEKEPGVVAHACNPSYLGGKDGEDCSLPV